MRLGWQVFLESGGISMGIMLIATYVIPQFLYRRLSGEWMMTLIPVAKLLGIVIQPLAGPLRFFQSLLDLGQPAGSEQEEGDNSEHIQAFISAGADEGILEEEDRHLIQQVVAFGDKTVREVMTSRPNIVAIAANKSLEDLRQLVIHEQFSRIPVYEDTIDHIIGFVHVRDMFELDPDQRKNKTVRDQLRPIRLVPETKPVNDLLREMQRDGVHMAVVIDEYGNTAGLATMEDLVEEILGEIHDEHEPDRDVKLESDHTYLAPGSLDLDRLEELVHFRPEEDTESTTVGGLVAEWLGHVPKVGESVEREGSALRLRPAMNYASNRCAFLAQPKRHPYEQGRERASDRLCVHRRTPKRRQINAFECADWRKVSDHCPTAANHTHVRAGCSDDTGRAGHFCGYTGDS